MSKKTSKVNSIVAWVIASLLLGLFTFSALGKLVFKPEMMDALKLGDWRIIIGIGELASALLFFIPKTNKIGTLLLSSYMGGAIIIHMTTAQPIIMPSVVLVLVWLVGYLRNPDLLK